MALPLLAILAAGQAIYGGIKAAKATSDFNKAAKDRQPYQTPEELFKVLKATQANAQSGYDPATMDYLTSQTDRAFSGSLGTLQQMGGDANSAAALFDQKLQGVMKIGAQNHALNLENFSKYIGALGTIADSKSAEWASRQDIVKDKMQAANANKKAAFENIQSGINTGVAAYAASETDNLYNNKDMGGGTTARAVTGSGSGSYSIGSSATAPPTSIVRNGVTMTWNPFTQKFEKQ